MSILNRSNKTAEDFDDLAEGRSPVRVYDADLERLARVTDALRATEAVSPRPEFAASLRERLVAEAQVELKNAPVALPPVQREGRMVRRFAVGISAAVLVGGLAGVSAASQHAGPGDALYPIKRSVESFTKNTDPGTEALKSADDKLSELETLVAEGASAAEVADVVDDFTADAKEGADALADGGDKSVAQVERFIERSTTVLDQLSAQADASVKPELAKATLAVKLLEAKLG